MNDYQVNQFGEAHLILEKKGCKRGISCFGTIEAIEKKYVLFKDMEGYLYLAERATFEFKPCERL
jgi:hypothetical protein